MTEIIERELTPEEIEERSVYEAGQHQRDINLVNEARRSAYQVESDPIFFQYQRGEKTEQEWLDAVNAVNAAYPYPEQPS